MGRNKRNKGGNEQSQKKELKLIKSSEKKDWKGKRVSFTAQAREGGKPTAKKPVIFFLDERKIAEAETDGEGKAFHSLLLEKGDHEIIAKMYDVRSNAVTIEITEKNHDTVILSRDTMIKDGVYRSLFTVLKNGDPVLGAILTITKNGIEGDLEPTDANGESVLDVTVTGKEFICLVTHKESNTTIWKNFFKTIKSSSSDKEALWVLQAPYLR